MEKVEQLLQGYRALDLTDEKGLLCGKILGDMGVDVIKVERPGGDASRNIGPFYHDIAHPEKSLFWFAYNTSKRGITLNINSNDGKEIFKRLVQGADIVIESFPVGYMDSLGLGFSTLSKVNPGLIMTSISPFGQTGPYKDYKAPDIVGVAMGGLMYLIGDTDRPPVRISYPQAYLNASAEAAVGTMIALHHREISGEGQQVDVSMQQSQIVNMLNAPLFWEVNRENLKRAGKYRGGRAKALIRYLWSCKDGFVIFHIYGGTTGAKTNRALVNWMDSEGMADDFLKAIDWDSFDYLTITPEMQESIEERVARFFAIKTKSELFEAAIKRGMSLGPVSSPKEVMANPQLKAREFWVKVEHPELHDSITYPGSFGKLSEAQCGIRRRAPLIGEHNEEVYLNEMGLSKEHLIILKQNNVI